MEDISYGKGIQCNLCLSGKLITMQKISNGLLNKSNELMVTFKEKKIFNKEHSSSIDTYANPRHDLNWPN